jgi:glycosyltransferase involved in cell wall biosynthesis
VFYGDCSGSGLHAILRARFPQAIIVSTVHQPISRLEQDPAGWASLHAVDAIITVSQIQASQLADRGLTASIHVVPHGVWTGAFHPASVSDRDQPIRESVLLVGNYLRDWNATRQAVQMFAKAGIKSVVLGSAAANHLHVRDPRVEISSRVSEVELARLYDRSAALLLLVEEATASNALLEAMSAGCPVVCPQFPSLVDEYLGDRVDSFAHERIDIAFARVLRYIRDPACRAARSQALMHRAEAFDWLRLRPSYAAVYKEILNRTHARSCLLSI